MAVYNQSGNAVSLDKLHAYAKKIIVPKLYSSLFPRNPFLAVIAGRNKVDGDIGRPGTMGIITGKNMNNAERNYESGSETHVFFHTQKTGGGKWMGVRDTTPSTGENSQDQNRKSAIFRQAKFMQPIKVWKSTIEAAQGDNEIAKATTDAVNEAVAETNDEIQDALWRGTPTDQSADRWSTMLGAIHAMNDDNTYGNVDRGTWTAWAGKRSTTSYTAGLNLIDKVNIKQGLLDKAGAPDLCIVSKDIYYDMKQEALAQGQATVVSSMPEAAEVGVKMECIQYGLTTIIYDPFLTGNWSSYDSDITDATKVMALFNTEDWIFSINKANNFRVDEFTDAGKQQGADDALTSNVSVQCGLRCVAPWRSMILTNVSHSS